MASNENNDEKPNLRPTKRIAASGKSIFLHHTPEHPSNKSYIQAVWNNKNEKTHENLTDKPDPFFGIEQPRVEYSLNKQQRWNILNDFRRHLTNNQSDSSSDDELDVQSDSEQQQKNRLKTKKKNSRRAIDSRETKYRLYEFHDIGFRDQASCVSITSNTGQQRTQIPKNTYMQGSLWSSISEGIRDSLHTNINDDNNERRTTAAADVTYYAVVPPPKEKQFANIRNQHIYKAKKVPLGVQRSKFTQMKESMDVGDDFVGDEEQSSTDDGDEPTTPNDASQKPGHLHLNDFIPPISNDDNVTTTIISENLVTIDKFDPKASRFYIDDIDPSHKFRRQISREEKLYNRDKAIYLQRQKSTGKKHQSNEKSYNHLMSFTFRSILLNKNDLSIEYLSKTYGKSFIHAQCYPTKYLLCLTDRLKSFKWSNQFDLFPTYSTLNSYLILLLNDDTSTNENFYRVQVGLNMDLYADTIEIESLYESTESIYKINDLIDKTIEFVTTLPFDTFKPIDSELNRRKLLQNEEDNELSESEFINKQIRHLHLLDKNHKQTKTILEDEQLNNDIPMEEYDLIKPDICTSCYRDMDDTIPMTALKSCAHWLCNDC
ncbi:unnamed protein product, partial [Adineta steineri]